MSKRNGAGRGEHTLRGRICGKHLDPEFNAFWQFLVNLNRNGYDVETLLGVSILKNINNEAINLIDSLAQIAFADGRSEINKNAKNIDICT